MKLKNVDPLFKNFQSFFLRSVCGHGITNTHYNDLLVNFQHFWGKNRLPRARGTIFYRELPILVKMFVFENLQFR